VRARLDIHVRRQPRGQTLLRLVQQDFRLEVLRHRPRPVVGQRDGVDGALEFLVGIGVDLHDGLLAHLQLAHVGLVNLGYHEHLGKIAHDHDDGARIVHGPGHDHLADLGVDTGNDAVNGRRDRGVAQGFLGLCDTGVGRFQVVLEHFQIQLGGIKGVLGRLVPRLQVVQCKLGLVERRLADVSRFEKLFLAFQIDPGLIE